MWSLDAIVTCALKSPNRTCGCDVPASSRPEYSMITSPPGRAAVGTTFLIFISAMNDVSNQAQSNKSIQSRADIVSNDAKPAFELLQTPNWKGFHDIEQPK